MKLIAKKPCSFGGKRFYIGDEIPAALVLDPVRQEKLGVLERKEGEKIAPAAKEAADDTAKKAPAKKGGKKPVEEAGEQ